MPNDWSTAFDVLVFGLNPSGVMENSGYPRSGSPYCTPPIANSCVEKNGPVFPATMPPFCVSPTTSFIPFGLPFWPPIFASVAKVLNSVVYRWNDAVPPSGPPLNCAWKLCSEPSVGNGISTRVSRVTSNPIVERRQPAQLFVVTSLSRPVPP